MPIPPKRRRPLRLSPEDYREAGRVFSVTLATSPRQPLFADLAFGRICIGLLKDLRDTHQVPVYAYCLMPDHVHLLVGVSPALPLPQLVQRWKSLCYQARRRRGNPTKFWQRSFFDHALRRDEDVRAVAQYILNNPVRAGLVEDFRSYALGGSLEWELG